MATLYKRASPLQRRVLRIIEGAVKNTADAHSIDLSDKFARSVAKRATGTLFANLADVLAIDGSSPRERRHGFIGAPTAAHLASGQGGRDSYVRAPHSEAI